MDTQNLPEHIAIIMDGNRRWAKKNGMIANFGHKEGAKTLEKIVRHANKIGIKYITAYAFSTENWKRSKDEVSALMLLFQSYLDDYTGSREGLSERLKKSINKAMEKTKNNTGITFNIALNYGGRDEILHAMKNIAEMVKNEKIEPNEITEEMISNNLYTQGEPDPDLLIRTSGIFRIFIFR